MLNGKVQALLVLDQRRYQHILHGSKLRQQKITLKHKPHSFVPNPRIHRGTVAVELAPFKKNFSGLGALQAAECIEQGRFAGARRSAEKNSLSSMNLKTDSPEDLYLPGTNLEGSIDLFGDDLRFVKHGDD